MSRSKPLGRISRPRLLLAFLAVCVLAGITGFLAGRGLSANQLKAQEVSQQKIPVYAPLGRQELGQTVIFQGYLNSPPTQEYKYRGGGTITTVLLHTGDTVQPGQLVATVDSNPVITAVGSAKPIYRDLKVGDQGYDVEALQEILNQLGYPTPISGKFDDATSKQLAQLYRKVGFTSPCGEEICMLEGTFLKMPMQTLSVAQVATPGTDTAENPLIFSSIEDQKIISSRISVSQKILFEKGEELTLQLPDGRTLESNDYSFSDFKEADSQTGTPGYDVMIRLPSEETQGLPDKTPVSFSPQTQTRSYLAIPAVAIRQESGQTYLETEEGRRITVEVALVEEGWAGLEENPELAEGLSIRIS